MRGCPKTTIILYPSENIHLASLRITIINHYALYQDVQSQANYDHKLRYTRKSERRAELAQVN